MNTRVLALKRYPSGSSSARWVLNRLTLGLLVSGLLLSAFGIVYVKDLNRRLFIQYQQLQQEQATAMNDWSKLLLEQSTWAAQARVQQVAEDRLGMYSPSTKEIILVKNVR